MPSNPSTIVQARKYKDASIKSYTDYFVSFCVMTEGANPMGHSCMLISQLDHRQGKTARVEVISALGLYSRYMPILGFKPYGVAKIKLEDMAYIANAKGLVHATYQISKKDVEVLLDTFYQDKLKIEQHEDSTDFKSPSVPMFNVFKKKNCKKYVLECLNRIGINTRHLSSFMEIPILNSLESMVILEEGNGSEKAYYWGSPISFKAKNDNETCRLNHDLQGKYASLYYICSRIKKLQAIIQLRQVELASLGKTVSEINKIEADLLALMGEIENLAEYPKLITKEKIFTLSRKLTYCIDGHIKNLSIKQLEPNLICVLTDVLQELLLYMKQLFCPADKRSQAKLNTMDREVFDKIQTTDAQMREQDKERNYAPDLLPNDSYRRATV